MANKISNAHLTVFMQAQVELKIGEADSTKWAKLISQALLHLNDRNNGNTPEMIFVGTGGTGGRVKILLTA